MSDTVPCHYKESKQGGHSVIMHALDSSSIDADDVAGFSLSTEHSLRTRLQRACQDWLTFCSYVAHAIRCSVVDGTVNSNVQFIMYANDRWLHQDGMVAIRIKFFMHLTSGKPEILQQTDTKHRLTMPVWFHQGFKQ